jgi:preprotein translocase subunit SecA
MTPLLVLFTLTSWWTDRVKIPRLVRQINAFEPDCQKLTDEQLRAKTGKFRARLREGETLDDLLPEAFAVVREASRRTIGLRHFDVQLVGGIVLHQGSIAEMATGEGKTLVATLPAYLNGLTGKGVHIVTVNDYLARRDAEWMGPIHRALGLTVGVIQHDLNTAQRREAYRCDITYGTNKEFGFDYLRDKLRASAQTNYSMYSPLESAVAVLQSRLDDLAQRPHHYAIVDEVDSILVDEARTPLIISGSGGGTSSESGLLQKADWLARQLREEAHFEVDLQRHSVELTPNGKHDIHRLVNQFLEPEDRVLDWEEKVEKALVAHNLYERDRDYLVRKGQVLIVDEFTGRALEGRQWRDGLHQAVEAKEGITSTTRQDGLARTTYQGYFKLYTKLAGMTGTARTQAMEFAEVYELRVAKIPTNRPLRRHHGPDRMFVTETAKFDAVCAEIAQLHAKGQPVLVGTRSIGRSEIISERLQALDIQHQVLNAKNDEIEAKIVAQAGERAAVTIATNMAGRGTDIKLADGVEGLGGLHVLGTERHESRRIDNQLAGRSGRQGDRGSSQFFLSLEDELFKVYNPAAAKRLAGVLAAGHGRSTDGGEAHSTWARLRARWLVARTQSKAETYHFTMRSQLLKHEEQMEKTLQPVFGARG